MINSIWLSGIHMDVHGFGNRSTLVKQQYLYQIYGSISPCGLKVDVAKMDAHMDPNRPIILLFKQLEDRQQFATAVGVPYTTDQLIS
eukprot:6487306-Ditylum_brightwellii.AAC.1